MFSDGFIFVLYVIFSSYVILAIELILLLVMYDNKSIRMLTLSTIVFFILAVYICGYEHSPTYEGFNDIKIGILLLFFEFFSLLSLGVTKIIIWIIKRIKMRKNNEFSLSALQRMEYIIFILLCIIFPLIYIIYLSICGYKISNIWL